MLIHPTYCNAMSIFRKIARFLDSSKRDLFLCFICLHMERVSSSYCFSPVEMLATIPWSLGIKGSGFIFVLLHTFNIGIANLDGIAESVVASPTQRVDVRM